MSYRMKDVREGLRSQDYPFYMTARSAMLGDVVELPNCTPWRLAVVSDTSHQNEEYPHITLWRPHMSLVTITGKREQPAVQFEVFEWGGDSPLRVVENVGREYVMGD